jgi:hypothetical protein
MIRIVGDLGAGAYLLMHKWKPLGRKGRDILFEVSESENKEFEALQLQYLTSEFHRFDACIMSLKKMNEYRE